MKIVKKLAHSALFIVCAVRAYRSPNEMPYIDDGEGLRPLTDAECAVEACVHGAALTRQIITSLKVIP